MGKDKERSIAWKMFVVQGKTQKEIAITLRLQEKTVGQWVNKHGWKAERNARQNSLAERSENIKKVISNITEQRLKLEEDRKAAIVDGNKELEYELDKQAVVIADEISKWNKALLSLDKDNRITLDTYLEIMDDVFKALGHFDNALYLKTLDFQEQHIQTMSLKLG
ncbi:hypothetical protein GFS24_10300 [Chitinophaga sp. SYP-B3965]|uniref:hypothetical protein n=1 Tax=Chitinophaga sp. SYP-B3965 TaxID=2663120 RepID=UPI001299DAA5|nr:hypothetical protein [Chitinophaga sp. SYP-B3965]MRG45508.1 hypothetical protein [Chitinophaga sp. SYP-B3965]